MTPPMKVVALFPDLLGTYGDGGNATVLVKRAAWRGLEAQLVEVSAGERPPDDGDVYVLGGGEDAPQVEAARSLCSSGGLTTRCAPMLARLARPQENS